MSDDRLYYTGPDLEYKAPLDDIWNQQTQRLISERSAGGYHDLDYLNDMLDKISTGAASVYARAEKILSEFSLKVDTSNTDLVKAHDLVYPADQTPGYITFDEYKYLLTTVDTHAVTYVRSYYENKLRGPKGSTALDLLLIARAIHAEVARIRNFLTTYIGELDETAEFRTVELFQDWTENTADIVERLKQAVQTQVIAEIPRAELDKLDAELSTNYQVLFQTKLNAINVTIQEAINNLEKNWSAPADTFYNRTLGPALLFQIKVANNLTDPNNLSNQALPTLINEVKGTVSGLSSNYTVALSDQMRRNELCQIYCTQALVNLDKRDVYRNYIGQLELAGKKLATPFVDSTAVEQAEEIYKSPHPLSHVENSGAKSTSIYPSHHDLFDRLLDDSHPQYLLKTGGTITGDIELAEDVRIGGIIPGRHKHDGKDGSEKISGSDIVPGTISSDIVDSGVSTSVPKNLFLVSQIGAVVPPGLIKVTAQVGFEVEGTSNIVGYEFEVTKLKQ